MDASCLKFKIYWQSRAIQKYLDFKQTKTVKKNAFKYSKFISLKTAKISDFWEFCPQSPSWSLADRGFAAIFPFIIYFSACFPEKFPQLSVQLHAFKKKKQVPSSHRSKERYRTCILKALTWTM